MDALALALAPRLRIECWPVAEPEGSGSGVWQAEIFNESEFAATNVVLEARFRDGQRLHERIERLGSGAIEGIRLREIKPPPAGPTTAQSGEELVFATPTSAVSGGTRFATCSWSREAGKTYRRRRHGRRSVSTDRLVL
jgi:hypothetical protein